jgi:hypothetical protein
MLKWVSGGITIEKVEHMSKEMRTQQNCKLDMGVSLTTNSIVDGA